MAGGDSSPLRRMLETLLERRGVRRGAKAVPHRVCGQIDVHVPLEHAILEPIQDFHDSLVEGQGHLERKVPVDRKDHAHKTVRNISGTRVNGAICGRPGCAGHTKCRGKMKNPGITAIALWGSSEPAERAVDCREGMAVLATALAASLLDRPAAVRRHS